jgi:hypothetical protein
MQERKQFVVTCKDCHRAVPSGVKEFPFHSIEVTCPLRGEQHRYLPSEVILGRPNELVAKKRAEGMKAWPVSRAVGNVRNNRPELVNPVEE